MAALKVATSVVKETFHSWTEHHAQRLGAALAFYAIFSIAPMLLLIISVVALWFGNQSAQAELMGKLKDQVGPQAADLIQGLLVAASKPRAGIIATVIGTATLLLGATGLFMQLQDALNAIWEVQPKPGLGIREFIRRRLLSLAMVLGAGLLLLASLLLSAAVSGMSQWNHGLIPGSEQLWQVVNFAVSLALLTLVFALLFKYLPDVKVAWRDVWLGGAVTALLITIGKFALGMYLSRSAVSSPYGAAGSVIILLLWIYYSAQILFLGAEFTKVYATRFGKKLEPADSAMWIPSQKAIA